MIEWSAVVLRWSVYFIRKTRSIYFFNLCFMSINYKKQEEELLALSYALKLLKAWFSQTPQIEWILYIDWIPEVVRTLIKTQVDYRQIQTRIFYISKNTWLSIENVRKLLKTKTLTELEGFIVEDWKIIFPDLIKVDKNLESEIE